jgi:hypothetical protein
MHPVFRSLLVAVLLLLPLPAAAIEYWEGPRLDHRGQPSLLVAPAIEHLIVGRPGEDTETGTALVADVAWGMPLTEEGGEGFVGVRAGAGFSDGDLRLAPFALYRGYYGDDAWKTYFDVGAVVRIEPVWGGGVRLGFGLQYDPTENLGFFAGLGGGIAFGDGLQTNVDFQSGLQLRFGSPG